MARCAAITRAGSRCRLEATDGSDCWSHAPEHAEARRRRARRGGKTGGNGRPGTGELVNIKRGVRFVVAGVLTDRIQTGPGAVALQGYNTLLRAVEVERRVFETEELERKMEALEAELERRARYGA